MLAAAASAQPLDVGGLVVDPSAVTVFDMYNLSQPHFGLGTARSAAMAGAYASLGGDAVSMAVNPAGLGMYSHNEVTLTPMMTFNRSRTDAPSFEGGARNRFAMGNVGIVLNVRESATGVTSLSIGFGYNRIADYNYRYSLSTLPQRSSIADLFARQLADGGLDSSYLGSESFRWGNIDPSLWGAALGYYTGLTGDSSGLWDRDMVGRNAAVTQYATVNSRGSAGEYLFSLGLNVNSKFYFGASLGIVSISQRRDIYYGESYDYDNDPRLNYVMDFFNYDQSASLSGAGVNLKVGIIYRPIKNLRLGFAFHTPTYCSLAYRYQGGMTSDVLAVDNVDGYDTDRSGYIDPPLSEATSTLVDDGRYGWDFITPSRMMFGASYTLGQFAVVSVDYERDWYNGIRVKGSPYGRGLYDNFARENFKGSNSLRIGAEVRIIPQLALRAGYGLWASALRDKRAIYSSPVVRRADYAGAGLGLALSKVFSLDISYSWQRDRYTDAMTFYYYNDYQDGAAPAFALSNDRHSVIATIGFKF